MKSILLLAFYFLFQALVTAQEPPLKAEEQKKIALLEAKLKTSEADTNRIRILQSIAYAYGVGYRPNKGEPYLREAVSLAKKLDNKKFQSSSLRVLSYVLLARGYTSEALTHLFQALRISEEIQNKNEIGENTKQIGAIYVLEKDYKKARPYLLQSKMFLEEVGNYGNLSITLDGLGVLHFADARYDSALHFFENSHRLGLKTKNTFILPISLMRMGNVHEKKGEYQAALKFYRQSLAYELPRTKGISTATVYLAMSKIFQNTAQPDSALFYGRFAFDTATGGEKVIASKFLSQLYDGKNDEAAYRYLKIANRLEDSIRSDEEALKIQNIAFQEQQNLQEIEAAKVQTRNRMRLYIILGLLTGVLIVAAILFHNNRRKQRANEILKRQKGEIELQRRKAEQAFKDLKTAQAQLIQSEKMASLGELTAGIAHEIQNPLNFVNNFSEVNKELTEELLQEAEKGNLAEVKALAKDLKENEQKINHHGKRADAIVKNMLQHSRSTSGSEEPTDINALADEYLKLAYHGLRAKDGSFNATIKTNYDQKIGTINIIPQDIGRVILNLITNAFYVVTEKKKEGINGYDPTVTVSTKQHAGGVEITVADNGNGIPEKYLEKIFQPFFTTKPTGQGTGLGLSLSYDIVKSHGGELRVETNGEAGTKFIVELPLNK